MSKPFDIYDAIKAQIAGFYTKPGEVVRKADALLSLWIMFNLFVGAEKLSKEVAGLDGSAAKAALLKYMAEHECLLLTEGEFMPEQADGSHLDPAAFIRYTRIAMEFFINNWDAASSQVRNIMISQLLAHNTLTYPRLVSYVQRWTPPERNDLFLTIIGWLHSDVTNAFTAEENSISNRAPIADQIVAHYQTMRDDKEAYCLFWGSLLAAVDKAFFLGFDRGLLYQKIKSNRMMMHQALIGFIGTQEVDGFIDHCFDDVYDWIILGGDDD